MTATERHPRELKEPKLKHSPNGQNQPIHRAEHNTDAERPNLPEPKKPKKGPQHATPPGHDTNTQDA